MACGNSLVWLLLVFRSLAEEAARGDAYSGSRKAGKERGVFAEGKELRARACFSAHGGGD